MISVEKAAAQKRNKKKGTQNMPINGCILNRSNQNPSHWKVLEATGYSSQHFKTFISNLKTVAQKTSVMNDMLSHSACHIISLNGLIMKVASKRREEFDMGL
jgi:hypothetical protein